MVMDAALPGPRLDLGFYVFTPLLVFLFLLSVVVTAAVAVAALVPIRSRRAWHLASIQTDAGYAAFRYRRHPRRVGYQLVDLSTTNRGAGLRLRTDRALPHRQTWGQPQLAIPELPDPHDPPKRVGGRPG